MATLFIQSDINIRLLKNRTVILKTRPNWINVELSEADPTRGTRFVQENSSFFLKVEIFSLYCLVLSSDYNKYFYSYDGVFYCYHSRMLKQHLYFCRKSYF